MIGCEDCGRSSPWPAWNFYEIEGQMVEQPYCPYCGSIDINDEGYDTAKSQQLRKETQ